jgi:hypothetical protein
LHFAVSGRGFLVNACTDPGGRGARTSRPGGVYCDSEETIWHEGHDPTLRARGRPPAGKAIGMNRARQRLPLTNADTRPNPTTRLEAEIREFWDAATALAVFDSDVITPERRMALPTAIASLTELATSHGSQRLRRAAADRLMSFAPETAARLMKRRSGEQRSHS